MRSSSTARFRKLRNCPSTEALLLHGRTTGASRDAVAAHLSACDFCGAEMQLLSHFPPPTTKALPFVALEIPRALLRLAEDLMDEPTLRRARYAESIQEIERLTLTDA
jgi:hypothetical protein